MAAKRKKNALARRYGRFAMSEVHKATADIRKLATDNPLATAIVIGSGIGAIGAGLTVGSAALVGGVAGVAIEQTLKSR